MKDQELIDQLEAILKRQTFRREQVLNDLRNVDGGIVLLKEEITMLTQRIKEREKEQNKEVTINRNAISEEPQQARLNLKK